jgi:hypothetical protein
MKKVAKYNISLKIFLKNRFWEILILKTPDDSSFHWKYDFPGWRIDENEFKTPYLEILKREISEEIWNVEVKIENKIVAIARHYAPKDDKEDEFIFYNFWEGEILNKEIKISEEHTDIKWVKLAEIDLEEYFESWMLEAVRMYLNK